MTVYKVQPMTHLLYIVDCFLKCWSGFKYTGSAVHPKLIDAWEKAFESENVTEGGCPIVQI